MNGGALPRRIVCAWFVAVLLVSAALCFADGLSLLYSNVGFSVPLSRVQAYDFQLEDLRGNKFSLKSLRGKIVLLNFWATWCKPCVDEMPDLEKLHRQYKDSNFVILMINFGESKEKVQGFVTRNGLSLNMLLDQAKEVSRRYRTFALPTTYLVDRDGYFLAGAMGRLKWSSPDFHTLIESLLNSAEHRPGR